MMCDFGVGGVYNLPNRKKVMKIESLVFQLFNFLFFYCTNITASVAIVVKSVIGINCHASLGENKVI